MSFLEIVSALSPMIPLILNYLFTGCSFGVSLATRKSAQFGVKHSFVLGANDFDIKLCPYRALINVATIYGDSKTPSGPLFVRLDKNGAPTKQALVSVLLLVLRLLC